LIVDQELLTGIAEKEKTMRLLRLFVSFEFAMEEKCAEVRIAMCVSSDEDSDALKSVCWDIRMVFVRLFVECQTIVIVLGILAFR
jgi:hypothetical protein